MKKTLTIGKVMVAFMVMFFALSANATDCSKAIDVVCQAINNMNKDVNACKSLEELSSLDFENCMNGVDADDLPDYCLKYRLTGDDKTKLRNSMKGFRENIVNKMYELSGGVISKDEIGSLMDVEINSFYKAIDNANTIEDFIDAIS